MHLPLVIEQHARTNRWANCHPAEKVAAAGAGVALAWHPQAAWMPVAVAVMAVVSVQRAGVPLAVLLKAAAMPLGFLLAASLPVAVTLGAAADAWWPVPHIDANGLALAVRTLVRAGAVTACTLALAFTTPIDDLAWLARRLGAPLPVVFTGLAVHRFLFQFTRTLTTLHAAQRARLGFVGWRGTIRSLGLISANLFGQSVSRAEALGRGIAARGGLSLRRQHLHEWSPRRLAIIAALGLLTALAGGLP